MSTYLDTRDLAKRKEELETLRDAIKTAREELAEKQTALDEHKALPVPEDEDEKEAHDETTEELETEVEDAQADLDVAISDFTDEEKEELAELEELENEISEWRHGETLIPCDSFEDYARELLEDCGDIPRDLPHYIVIDWSATAENLLADYSTVTYQGTSYYVRNC